MGKSFLECSFIYLTSDLKASIAPDPSSLTPRVLIPKDSVSRCLWLKAADGLCKNQRTPSALTVMQGRPRAAGVNPWNLDLTAEGGSHELAKNLEMSTLRCRHSRFEKDESSCFLGRIALLFSPADTHGQALGIWH